jgi:3-phenylpropionate/cinnamic acid dioxygenase small subunit
MPDHLERLVAKSDIYDALVRYCRSCDRQDIGAMLQAFHPDAEVNMGYYVGPAAGFCERFAALGDPARSPLSRVQHQVSNVLCDVEGAFANVESYWRVLRRRQAEDKAFDEMIASRLLDRFERRNGRWAVLRRRVIWDWMISVPATPAFWEAGPGAFLVGRRDDADPSCEIFPRKPFDASGADPAKWTPQP